MARPSADNLSAGVASDLFAVPRVLAERRDDGTLLLRSAEELGVSAPSIAHLFRARAREHPDRVLVAERVGNSWTEMTWGEADQAVQRIAAALLEAGLTAERPLMILSGNSIEHLLLMLGSFAAGVPVVPVSTAYSLLSQDHERIRAIAGLCTPGMVFADDADAYARALDRLRPLVPCELVGRGDRPRAVPFTELTTTAPGTAAEDAFGSVGPDTVAKILFTSGSTGPPKGVINTQRMLCSNQQALGQVWPFLHREPPTLVDWLPWSHTFGGNHNVNQVIAFGGSLYIDDGRPAPAPFERTVAALREIAPTVYYNVPAGYALLAPRLEDHRQFAEHFFSRLRFMFYAAAALPEALWRRMRDVAITVADHPVPLTASWGTTETAPAATTAHFSSARCGCIGVPLPGVTLKLVPDGDQREVRLTGPNVTPGYHRDRDATAAAFDEEGYYRTGDAVRLQNEDDVSQGLMFDGRLAEDFKLATGTWVRVGNLRTELLSAAGVLSDAVICGHDGPYVGALAWLSPTEAKRILDVEHEVSADDLRLVAYLARCLARLNQGAGAALRIERLALLATPPEIDAGEVTDKGYINQRAVLTRRRHEVQRLFAKPVGEGIITPDRH